MSLMLDTIEGWATDQPGDLPETVDAGWSTALAATVARDAKLREALEEAGNAPCACVWLPLPPRRVWCGGCIARAALTPPPEAEKKGGDDGR